MKDTHLKLVDGTSSLVKEHNLKQSLSKIVGMYGVSPDSTTHHTKMSIASTSPEYQKRFVLS